MNDANTADANATENDTADDLTPASIFGETFDTATGTDGNVTTEAFKDGVLTIPATQMTPATEQFDFMYSNIVTTGPQADPVGLTFSHLFCAVSFGMKNDGDKDVTISNIKVEKLYTKKSATVSFAGSESSVEYKNESQDTYIDVSPTNFTIASGEHSNIVYNNGWTVTAATKDDDASTRQYYLMWPQNPEDVHSDDEMSVVEHEEEGYYKGWQWIVAQEAWTEITYPDTWLISMIYTQDGGTETSIRLNFPDAAWEAGKKYHFDIHFARTVELHFKVVDWEAVSDLKIEYN